jgi:branched-chain amino acid transport system substrate-binding protein
MAVAEINAGGRLLGQPLAMVTADDYCDAGQALAAAHKLVAAGVAAVIGHGCSGAAIPASAVSYVWHVWQEGEFMPLEPEAAR